MHTRWLSLLLFLPLLASLALAEDMPDTGASTQRALADKVHAAFSAQKPLDGLVSGSGNVWLVADELLIRGQRPTAEAFAKLVPGEPGEKLRAYVAARSDARGRLEAQRALAALQAQLKSRRLPPGALKTLDGISTEERDLVSWRVFHNRGRVLQATGRLPESVKVLRTAAERARALGHEAGVASSLSEAARSAAMMQDWRGMAELGERELEIREKLGDRADLAASLINHGSNYARSGNFEQARTLLERGLAEAEAAKHDQWMANALINLGGLHRMRAEYVKAAAYLERGVEKVKALGDRAGLAAARLNLGNVYAAQDRLEEAIASYTGAIQEAEAAGDGRAVARAEANLAMVYVELGQPENAQAYLERSIQTFERVGNRYMVARLLRTVGESQFLRGDLDAALALYERSLSLAKQLRHGVGVADALSRIGTIQWTRGEHAKAIASMEEAIRIRRMIQDTNGLASDLNNLATIHVTLGATKEATAVFEELMKSYERSGNRVRLAGAHINFGTMLAHQGEEEQGRKHLLRGLELARETSTDNWIANALNNLARRHIVQEAWEEALKLLEESVEIRERSGDRRNMVTDLSNLSSCHAGLGNLDAALASAKRAHEVALEVAAPSAELEALSKLVLIHLKRRDFPAALAAARSAAPKLALAVQGLAEEQSAVARETLGASVLEGGLLAAMELRDPEQVAYFVESGRAAALLESLGGRAALGDDFLPASLREEERDARAAIVTRQAALAKARRSGRLRSIKRARKALDKANTDLLETVGRIQRASKASANVAYPEVASLQEVKASVRPDEALVSYFRSGGALFAQVVRRDVSRVVQVDDHPPELTIADPDTAWQKQIAALREAVVTPLGLGDDVKRVLVAPEGSLAYVPFSLLFSGRDVAYVPSGTSYGVLRAVPSKRGVKVLAIGDPRYEGRLAQLSATRAEVTAIGDEVLLGADTTEVGLREIVAKEKRWRAVHLACHGIVDPERPLLSSLALTADEQDDGFLTALEVFRMTIPTDLLVMSACETGKGKVYKTEGIVGLTRAFMYAGAPRVICSLWKVDDEATQALMIKFYELWNPKEGEGLGAAAALKAAQAHVRAQEKWSHPYYWAAWVLWGLPD